MAINEAKLILQNQTRFERPHSIYGDVAPAAIANSDRADVSVEGSEVPGLRHAALQDAAADAGEHLTRDQHIAEQLPSVWAAPFNLAWSNRWPKSHHSVAKSFRIGDGPLHVCCGKHYSIGACFELEVHGRDAFKLNRPLKPTRSLQLIQTQYAECVERGRVVPVVLQPLVWSVDESCLPSPVVVATVASPSSTLFSLSGDIVAATAAVSNQSKTRTKPVSKSSSSRSSTCPPPTPSDAEVAKARTAARKILSAMVNECPQAEGVDNDEESDHLEEWLNDLSDDDLETAPTAPAEEPAAAPAPAEEPAAPHSDVVAVVRALWAKECDESIVALNHMQSILATQSDNTATLLYSTNLSLIAVRDGWSVGVNFYYWSRQASRLGWAHPVHLDPKDRVKYNVPNQLGSQQIDMVELIQRRDALVIVPNVGTSMFQMARPDMPPTLVRLRKMFCCSLNGMFPICTRCVFCNSTGGSLVTCPMCLLTHHAQCAKEYGLRVVNSPEPVMRSRLGAPVRLLSTMWTAFDICHICRCQNGEELQPGAAAWELELPLQISRGVRNR